VIGEWRRFRGLGYYALVGIGIAGLGFFLQYRSEAAGDLSILNTYALSAFALTGLIGGGLYWLAAGRHAGGRGPLQSTAHGPSDGIASPAETASAAAELPKA
jgi:hypothetical protein